MNIVQLRQNLRAVPTALVALTCALTPSTTNANSRTYTVNGDFDQGVLTNVNYNTPDQLQLSSTITALPFMWIANAGEDTVSKINTNTGREVARYRTGFGPSGQAGYFNHWGDPWRGAAPSRTAVDASGNVYVANREFESKQSVIVKILATGGIDRNGNGTIETSSDLDNNGVINGAEIKNLADTNGNGYVDANEIQDERIAWFARVGAVNGVARSLSIGPDGHLWVGLFTTREYYKISSVDGSVLAGPVSVSPNYPYGSLVDSAGILYGAGLNNQFIKLNTSTLAVQNFTHLGENYGIALGNATDGTPRVYLALRSHGSNIVAVFNPATSTFSYINLPNSAGTLGISTDSAGDIFLSAATSTVSGGYALGATKLRPDGSVVWTKGPQSGATGGDQRGAIVDSNNDVWTVNRLNASVSKFRGTDGTALGVYPVGNQPYTYSDASGSAFLQSNPAGDWTVTHDTGYAGTSDGSISWTASVPSGTTLQVQVRAANTVAGLEAQTYVNATNGANVAGITGRYWQVKASLAGTWVGQALTTPVLNDLTITTNQAPTVACPAPVVAQCPGEQTLTFNAADVDGDSLSYTIRVGGDVVASGAVNGPIVLTRPFANGVHSVQVTVSDGRLSSSCTTTVSVSDTQAPTLTVPAAIVVSNAPGRCDAVVEFSVNAADNCGTVNVVSTPASGSTFPKGTTTVTVVATDGSGLTTTRTFTVTVNDTEAPSLTVPGPIAVSTAPGRCDAVVNFNVSAADNCGQVSVVTTPASGSTFPKGTTTVTAVATDSAGLTTTRTFTVTVNDTEAPSLTVPAPIVASTAPGRCDAVVTFAVSAADNCPGVTVVSTPASGSVFAKGTTTVTSVATDAAGLTTTRTFTVTVNDTEAPSLTVPAAIVVGNTPNRCDAVVNFNVTAADNCPGVTVVSTPASGSIFPKGTTTVTSVATDASGLTTTRTFTVTVNDVQAPVGTCVPTTNPSGNNVPAAGNNPRSGQNPDGFYQLLGSDNCDAPGALALYVKDSGSNYVAGPFAHGTRVKITQAPGGNPTTQPMAGVVPWHIRLRGDALLVVRDSSGNESVAAACLVPPAPR
jgi:hypothetical protein